MVYNYVAIIVAAIAAFLLGWLWYGPFFGKQWVKLLGVTPAQTKQMQKQAAKSMSIGFLTYLIMAMILAVMLSTLGVVSATGGMWTALLVWLGFVFTIQLGSVLWENKPMQLFAINVGYHLVSFLLMGAIIGAF